MNKSRIVFSLLATGLFLLTSCGDNRPVSESGIQRFSMASDSDEENVYELIVIHYWQSKNNYPVLAVVTMTKNSQVQSLPVTSRTEKGVIEKIYLTLDDQEKVLPLFDDRLVSELKVPVYFSTDGVSASRIILSHQDFLTFLKLAEQKKYSEAKDLMLESKLDTQNGMKR